MLGFGGVWWIIKDEWELVGRVIWVGIGVLGEDGMEFEGKFLFWWDGVDEWVWMMWEIGCVMGRRWLCDKFGKVEWVLLVEEGGVGICWLGIGCLGVNEIGVILGR